MLLASLLGLLFHLIMETIRSSETSTNVYNAYSALLLRRMYSLVQNLLCQRVCLGTRGSVVVKVLCYKPEGRGFDTRIYLILPAALGPEVYSASNRNKYQKQKKSCFWRVERGLCVQLTTLPASVSRMSRQCRRILNISQPYRPPRPVTRVASFYFLNGMSVRGGDSLCDLVVRFLGYRSIGQGSISGASRFSEK
jgi:hypothetical protein